MPSHARPDVPQPDPIVHDKPGDLRQVPCPGEADDSVPGVPHADQTVADDEMKES
ncbi:hypothetical protein [Azomonas macrocytogenes]|uniref:Uncharacterized protein n=1 Tax=Azomonas macrocytogenes TaxID=69962 RepID=A0A839SZS8_AZOMA|nr:hypothetical protein [Azomonas macrocytogenes]MBB3101780.1 hypothetical protein [Azomonas macrocytogenes]